jgi:hypothetical protein
MAAELSDVLQAIYAGTEVLPGPGKDVPDDDEEDEDMAADGLADHYRWPDPRATAKEPAEDDIPDKELEDAEQEDDDKQREQRKLLGELFADGPRPFAAEAPAPAAPPASTAPQQRQPQRQREASTRSLALPEMQAISLGMTLRGRTLTCDSSAALSDPIKPIVLSPPVVGGGEIEFRIGERWLGQNEFFCVCDQQLDAIRGGIQRCREHSAWGYISRPGAFSIGGSSWWTERGATNGSVITIRLIPAGAKGRQLQFLVDGRPIPTAGCAVPLQALYVPRGQQVRFGVLFIGDCRGDTCEVVGAQGLASQSLAPATQGHGGYSYSRGGILSGASTGTSQPSRALTSWIG